MTDRFWLPFGDDFLRGKEGKERKGRKERLCLPTALLCLNLRKSTKNGDKRKRDWSEEEEEEERREGTREPNRKRRRSSFPFFLDLGEFQSRTVLSPPHCTSFVKEPKRKTPQKKERKENEREQIDNEKQ